MVIQKNKQYHNKTWLFLIPTLKTYGNSFSVKFNNLHIITVGIYDGAFNGKDIDKKLLFVLCNSKIRAQLFKNSLNYFKYQPYFYKHYMFFPDKQDLQMLVFKIPMKWFNSYDNFLKSNYSKMFTEKDIALLFTNKKGEGYNIMHRTEEAYMNMIEDIRVEFNTIITKHDLLGGELSLPLKLEEEIFNYNKDIDLLIKK